MAENVAAGVRVDAIVGVPPAYELGVAEPISAQKQQVLDEQGTPTALSLASNQAEVQGQDVVGGALPLQVSGLPVEAPDVTWGRLIRLRGYNGGFYDVGVDVGGNLFINTPDSTQTEHVLVLNGQSVTITGAVAFPGIPPSSSAPSGANLESVVVDTNTGKLYYI